MQFRGKWMIVALIFYQTGADDFLNLYFYCCSSTAIATAGSNPSPPAPNNPPPSSLRRVYFQGEMLIVALFLFSRCSQFSDFPFARITAIHPPNE
jgi:hypothetical protein